MHRTLTYVCDFIWHQDCWYLGTVARYHRRKRRHRVEYDDGDHEWVNLLDECDRVQVQTEDGLWNMVSAAAMMHACMVGIIFLRRKFVSGKWVLSRVALFAWGQVYLFPSLFSPLLLTLLYDFPPNTTMRCAVHDVPVRGDAERVPQEGGQAGEGELPGAGLPGREPVALLRGRRQQGGHVPLQRHR
jgi:hypothetical protein